MLSRSEGEELQRKMVKGDYDGLQRICLSSCMITDHLSNRYASDHETRLQQDVLLRRSIHFRKYHYDCDVPHTSGDSWCGTCLTMDCLLPPTAYVVRVLRTRCNCSKFGASS